MYLIIHLINIRHSINGSLKSSRLVTIFRIGSFKTSYGLVKMEQTVVIISLTI